MTDSDTAALNAITLAQALSAFVDTLLPGNEQFPSASAAGIHGLFAERLRRQIGQQGLDRIMLAIAECGGPLPALSGQERIALVQRFEQQHAELFDLLRMQAYLAYYENPLIVRAMSGFGRPYNDAPQPLGYPMAAFDHSDPLQAPAHKRGHFLRTEEVKRVDLSTLAQQPLAPEAVTDNDRVESGRGLLSKGTRSAGEKQGTRSAGEKR